MPKKSASKAAGSGRKEPTRGAERGASPSRRPTGTSPNVSRPATSNSQNDSGVSAPGNRQAADSTARAPPGERGSPGGVWRVGAWRTPPASAGDSESAPAPVAGLAP